MERKENPHMRRRNGFTLIELLVVMGIISLLLGILLPALNNARAKARETKDGTQVKQVHQSWVTKAIDSPTGRFPLPGEINRVGTMAGRGNEDEAKNDHAALYSACVAMNLFSPQLLISPSETSGRVAPCSNYDFTRYDPAKDIYWDGDVTNPSGSTACNPVNLTTDLEVKSNTSYATMPLTPRAATAKRSNRRDNHWKNSSDSKFAAFGNRGARNGSETGTDFSNSKTLEIHGGKNSWEGNLCFNDNHISFERTFYPLGMVCVPGGMTPPAGDTTCGTSTGTGATALGLDNIFKADDATSSTDSFLVQQRKVDTDVTKATGWD